MPHEKREDAEAKAKELGMDVSQVVSSKAGYFIAPNGITSKVAKEVYAKSRADGKDKETAAKIAWSVQNKIDKKD